MSSTIPPSVDDIRHFPRARVLPEGRTPAAAQRFVLHGESEPHDHDYLEFVLVTGGNGRLEHLNGTTNLRRGSLVLTCLGAWHRYRDCRYLRLWNVYVAPELFDRELHWLREDAAFGVLFGGHGKLVATTCEEAECRQGEALLATLGEASGAYIGGVAAILAWLAAMREPLGSLSRQIAQRPRHAAVLRAMRAMERELDRRWTLAELSTAAFGISESYLNRLFRRELGESPLGWLARRRVERAASLLRWTRTPVAEVGRQVGWDDPNYFARRFRQLMGASPSSWRTRQ